ncbi:MAG TPA: sterol desaturase family protein [Blastocatellia bacterium]|nr:sterol desaturase family protein [Blastocatellia bacterium]
MSDTFLSAKFIVVCLFVLIWVAESVFPYARGRSHRLRHAARNLTLTGINALATALLAAFLLVNVASWAEAANLGLLRLVSLPPLWATIAAFILLDAWMYVWHRANHELPFLWRFHRVHHSDTEMDVTSAMRFHAGEIMISGLLRAAVIPVLGLSMQQVLLYDAVMLPVIFLHHSNVHLPESIDRILRAVITTPAIHRVHHSQLTAEANSNYGTIFSFWDRLARSFRLRQDGTRVAFGVQGFEGEEWQTVRGLLLTPFSVDGYFTPAQRKVALNEAFSPQRRRESRS